MSGCFPLAADLSQASAQARSALSAAPLVASGPAIALFDELGVLRFLLAPGDRRDLWSFAHKVLGPILDYDRAHDTDLVRTIEIYLVNDCNLQRTAAALFVHPKTVRYRLERIHTLGQVDLSRQQDRFDTQLGITILRALSVGERE
jgi:DNA-binding PucR family transcriptional regulator